ncbi:LysR substrate-binding domain-containing protein [Tabrizicola sp. J26]|uniref:LysR substrate-binding domain-containing protein n=1 Tax=Alitabrizicola rongguiensis TaxID=2909234 RepID=UPI001F482555|nr:LysR substrate-binding domain-containing protein [Tabrizicola rongguiensis]MCF1709309.1 LysR substrate-binding domain-containing protein [Tabrizicola rongguiensis]
MAQVPLNALRAFDAVVRAGTFKAAADALFVTQSAVSHQVRHLEDWLGRPLFDRSGPRPRLLPEGEELARTLALSFDGIEAACQRLRRESGESRLVIAAIPSVALCWLIPRLAGFRADHPEVATRIVYAYHRQEIDFSDVDLAFIYAPQSTVAEGHLEAELFFPGTSIAVCSPKLATGPVEPEAMARMTLLHDSDGAGWLDWFRQAGVERVDLPDGPAFQDFNLLRAAALAGQGVALCPHAMIRDDLLAGRLSQLSRIKVEPASGYYLVRSSASGRRNAAVRAFRDWAFAEREKSQDA